MAKKKAKGDSALRALRRYVIVRDNYTCQVCGVYHPEGRGLDLSHHIGRRKGSTKYEPDNVSMKCRKCHQHMDTHPLEHADWVREWLGPDRYEELKRKEQMEWRAKDTDFGEMCERFNQMRRDLCGK